MTNKQERGAIMLEVLAVLALIGVMGPMLYKQVLSRNQEISNVNIAAEMRAIKEAMSAAIAADSAVLGQLCGLSDSLTPCGAGEGTFQTAVEEFLPIGMDGILDADYGYTIKLYGQNAQLQNGEDLPIFVGVVAGADLAGDWNWKRAARIANLIGTDGGITQGEHLVGTGGSWQLYDMAEDLEKELQVADEYPIVVATTAMDTFDPDLGVTDPNAVFVPDNLGLAQLHAWNYFSVAGNENCIEVDHNRLGGSDKIYRAGETSDNGNCDPLFWVDGDATDLSKRGHVYVKNNLYIGLDGDNKSFAFERKDATGGDLTNNRFVVYDMSGNEKLEINDKGQIIAKDDKMTITKADGTTDTYDYGLDPANTSVLNDIRLASRGGARLSDILPNYISKGMYQISSSTHPVSYTVPKPACPENYAAAVIVTPLKWGMPKAADIQLPEVTAVHSLSVSGTSVKGDIKVPEQTILAKDIIVSRHNFAIEINPKKSESGDRIIGTDDADWTVKLGYKTNSDVSTFQTLSDFEDGEIQALAQTYCVYAPSDTTYDPNALTGDKISDNLK